MMFSVNSRERKGIERWNYLEWFISISCADEFLSRINPPGEFPVPVAGTISDIQWLSEKPVQDAADSRQIFVSCHQGACPMEVHSSIPG
jgi:hypothetical protein